MGKKVKVVSVVSFKTECILDIESDYPDLKTLEDVIDFEKKGIEEEPMFIVDGGDMTVDVKAEWVP